MTAALNPEIVVAVWEPTAQVRVGFDFSTERLLLSPKQARALARMLSQAARRAERVMIEGMLTAEDCRP